MTSPNKISKIKRSIMSVGAMISDPMSSCGYVTLQKAREKAVGAILILTLASLIVATGAGAQSKLRDGEATSAQMVVRSVASANPGERIVLAAGDYGELAIRGQKFASPGVVIEAAPGAKVTFSSVAFDQSEGITLKGVDIKIVSGNYGVTVVNSSQIKLSSLTIHAPAGKSPNAMLLRRASHVVVEDCDIRNVAFGIAYVESEYLKIIRNNFTDLQVDAIRGSASYVEVIGNKAKDFHPKPGDHPDFIQFWGRGAAGPNKSNVIKDNVYERGDGDPAQGIFIEDNDDIVIAGNILFGTMYNAISLARVHGAFVEGNFVQGYDDMGVRITTRGQSTNVTVRDNVSPTVLNYAEQGRPNPGYKAERNRSIRNAKPGDRKDLQAWLAKRSAP